MSFTSSPSNVLNNVALYHQLRIRALAAVPYVSSFRVMAHESWAADELRKELVATPDQISGLRSLASRVLGVMEVI